MGRLLMSEIIKKLSREAEPEGKKNTKKGSIRAVDNVVKDKIGYRDDIVLGIKSEIATKYSRSNKG